MSTSPARISRIIVRDFRFFPGDETCTFNLGDDGKNLLLFGENGSGKSSLFQGLRLLLSEKPPTAAFENYRNVFCPGVEGTIAIELTAGTPHDLAWQYGEPHPAGGGDVAFFDLARRATFLDYKALLRTNVFHEDVDCINLFALLVEVLLRDAELPDGRTVFDHWDALQHLEASTPPLAADDGESEESPCAAEQINEEAAAFRNQLDDLLNVSAGGGVSIVAVANRLLAKLTAGLEIRTQVAPLEVAEVSDDPAMQPHTLAGAEVRLIATYAGQPIDHPARFLNEGRLTAMALALYLAAAHLTTPRGGELPRLLILDDVLIGLDWSNRLPILKIIDEEFADWQVVLMTFDRVWFDLVREHTEQTGRWCYLTLRELPNGAGQPGRPIVEGCTNLLERAETHLANGDLMAAAVYIRAAFETRLKNVCCNYGVKVAYKPNPKNVKADQLWDAIVERQKARQAEGKADFIEPTLMQDVETVRSTVRNRLSHVGAPNLVTAEVAQALNTIRRLQNYEFKKVS